MRPTTISATVLVSGLALLVAPLARAGGPTSRPYEEVTYQYVSRLDPPQQIHVVTVDLSDRDVTLKAAPGGPDPDGAGKWKTTLLPTSEIAEREGFEVAVNGDFFSVGWLEGQAPPAGEGGKVKGPGYRRGVAATVSGPAATVGEQWATPAKPRPAMLVDRDGRVSLAEARELPPNVREAVAGSDMIVRAGRSIARKGSGFADTRHPRTAVGIDRAGKTLLLVVVDGRRPTAVGMSLAELADLMIELGASSAINLDGGGSTTLVLRDPSTGEAKMMNHPSGGAQRPVANVLGVDVITPAEPDD